MTITQKGDHHSILAKLRHRNIILAKLEKAYKIPSSNIKNIWTQLNEKIEHTIPLPTLSGCSPSRCLSIATSKAAFAFLKQKKSVIRFPLFTTYSTIMPLKPHCKNMQSISHSFLIT
ncbi:hypothetical protein [Bartonella henselae]|uniref:hypothetical protein n=1 Tax=Bartonella henselae TaxID=38323 RepID=UPI000A972F04|nr:hypothetical protein [Bartonella henselae]